MIKAIYNFKAITETTVAMDVSWLKGCDYKLWENPRSPDGRKQYENQISSQNKIEVVYYAQTDFLQCHTDTHNASHMLGSLSPVFCIAQESIMNNKRTVIIGTMRRVIYDVLYNVNESEHFINDVAD